MQFIPDAQTLTAYTLASVILFATPGPDMSLFLARTIAGGRMAGIASMAGASFGCLVHTALAAVGLSALIAASPAAFGVVKIGGALYLLWLAIDAIRNGSALNPASDDKPPASLRRTFLMGVMVNLSNPKVVLFFVTFLPQFVQADDPHAAAKLAFLGVYMLIVTLPLAVLMILGAERMVEGLRRRPRVMRSIDYIFAGFFGAFAARTLLVESR
jgi:threonine/homoserine/homoserine lactone efflux protein